MSAGGWRWEELWRNSKTKSRSWWFSATCGERREDRTLSGVWRCYLQKWPALCFKKRSLILLLKLVSWLLRTARHGSQVPVRMLLVVRHGIQPRVRQQAVMVVDAVTRQTGRSKSEAAGRRDTHAALKTRRQSQVRQEVLRRSRAAARSIKVNALVSYIQVLILRTCDHLSFDIGAPRSHRSLPWALHLPRAAHAAAKLPTLVYLQSPRQNWLIGKLQSNPCPQSKLPS